MGGILSQLVSQKFQTEHDATMTKIGAYKSVIGDPTSTPEAKEYALSQMMDMAPGGKKASEHLTPLFKKMLGIDKPAGAAPDPSKVKGGGPDPTQAVSGPMSMLGQTAPTTTPQPTPSNATVDLATPETITGTPAPPPAPVAVPPPVASLLAAQAPPAPPAPPPTPADPGMASIEAAVTARPTSPASRPSRFYMTPEEIQAQQIKFAGQEGEQRTAQAIKLKRLSEELATTSDTAKRVSLVKEMKGLGATSDQILEGVYRVPKELALPNQKREFVRGPSGVPVPIATNPKTNQRVFMDGSPVPMDATIVAAPSAFNSGDDPKFGMFAQFFYARKGDGMTPEAARAAAAKDLFRYYGVSMSAREQDMSMKQFVSGIGPGAGFAPTISGAAPTATPQLPMRPAPGQSLSDWYAGVQPGLTTPSTPAVDSTGAPIPPTTPPTRTILTPGGGTKQVPVDSTGKPVTPQGIPLVAPTQQRTLTRPNAPVEFEAKLSPFEDRAVNTARRWLLEGKEPTNMAQQVQFQQGIGVLQRQTGMSPEQIRAAVSTNNATFEQLRAIGGRQSAFESVQNVLSGHIGILNQLSTGVTDTGIPVLNMKVRDFMRKYAGDPNMSNYALAVNAVEREYARMVSGGVQSKGMPLAKSGDEAKDLFEGMTMDMMAKGAVQMRQEAEVERQKLAQQYSEKAKEMGVSLEKKQQVLEKSAEMKKEGYGAQGDQSWRKPPAPKTLIDTPTAVKYMQKYGDRTKAEVAAQQDGWIFPQATKKAK